MNSMNDFPIVQYAMRNLPVRMDFEAWEIFQALHVRNPQVNETTKAALMQLEHIVGMSNNMLLEVGNLRFPILSMRLAEPITRRTDERAPIHAAYNPLDDTMYFAPYPVQMNLGHIDAAVRMQRDQSWREFVNEIVDVRPDLGRYDPGVPPAAPAPAEEEKPCQTTD